MTDKLILHIEAIIFSAEQPVSVDEILQCLKKVYPETQMEETQIIASIESLVQKYNSGDFSFGLIQTGGGWQFLSKEGYHKTVSSFLNVKDNRKLSTPALETLSIIAYKQPVTKAEIEFIRGVSCDYTINKLLEKDLIEIAGKKDAPGKPLLYEVSQTFLDFFGINSTDDLPQLKEIESPESNTIGIPFE